MTPALTMTPATAAVARIANPHGWPLIFSRSRDWRSLTFAGEQISLTFKLPDDAAREAAEAIVASADDLSLDDAAFILADFRPLIDGDTLKIEALTVEA